jgi:hypothetical protein
MIIISGSRLSNNAINASMTLSGRRVAGRLQGRFPWLAGLAVDARVDEPFRLRGGSR